MLGVVWQKWGADKRDTVQFGTIHDDDVNDFDAMGGLCHSLDKLGEAL